MFCVVDCVLCRGLLGGRLLSRLSMFELPDLLCRALQVQDNSSLRHEAVPIAEYSSWQRQWYTLHPKLEADLLYGIVAILQVRRGMKPALVKEFFPTTEEFGTDVPWTGNIVQLVDGALGYQGEVVLHLN